MNELPHPALGSVFEKLKQFPVRRVILFGSRARGDNQDRADIDVAIDAPDISNSQWIMIQDLFEQADTLLGIDCVLMSHADDRMLANIKKDGKVIYERT